MSVPYLDAVLEEVAGRAVALLLVQGLAEDDDLLKEEDPPLLHPGQKAPVLVRDHERVLEEQPALGHDLTLERREAWRGNKCTVAHCSPNAGSGPICGSRKHFYGSPVLWFPTFCFKLLLFQNIFKKSVPKKKQRFSWIESKIQ